MLRLFHHLRLFTFTICAWMLSAAQVADAQNCVADGTADTNGDCIVDPLDTGYVLARFGCPVGTGNVECDSADANGDGVVDPLDAGFILARFCGGGTLPELSVDPVITLTSDASITLSGTTLAATSVLITGGAESASASAWNCTFSATVELKPNAVNALFLTPISESGLTGIPVPITVTQDSQVPSLFIDFPAADSEVTTDHTDVAGRVGDVLSGFSGLTVNVNGVQAEVDVGFGTNGTFFAAAVPLETGINTLTATATDAVGNAISKQIDVTRVEVPPNSPFMTMISGNGQSSLVSSLLPDPIVIQVNSALGKPLAGKLVTFDVTRSNGRLSVDGAGPGALLLQIFTDSSGQARAFWTLGSDAGCGNNRVEATSKDILGTTQFCASASPRPASQINIGAGHLQRAETGGSAPEKLSAWVNDSINPITGVAVTFTVTRGNGSVNGAPSATVNTDLTGHAEVNFTLGTEPGNNHIEADFFSNPGNPVTFVVYGVERNASIPTSMTGVVMNNARQPIQGATIYLEILEVYFGPVVSDIDGRFAFDNLPMSGPAELMVEGATAFHVGGANGIDVPLGTYPYLHYTPVIVPNAVNTLPTPVLLPPLNPSNNVLFDNTQDVELTVEGVAGLRFIVRAGSMTNADGTIPSPETPAFLSLNAVQAEDVPMAPPDGAWNPYAGTLQPSNSKFDPPVEIIWPNFMGQPGGAIANFMSFNHDTNRFEIVATGKVTDDGLQIVSDPGVGIATAGWHVTSPPTTVIGGASGGPPPGCSPPCDAALCEVCVDGSCVSTCDGDNCEECVNGQCSACGSCQECENGICIPLCGPCESCDPQAGCVISPDLECPDGSGNICCPENCQTCVNNECISTCAELQSCIDGTCVGDPGSPCALDGDCASGTCLGGSCQPGPGSPGDPCDSAADCSPSNCNIDSGFCAGNDGDPCDFDAECVSGSCVDNLCDDGPNGPGEPCGLDGDCASGTCLGGSCQPGPGGPGDPCDSAADCSPSNCNIDSGFCAGNDGDPCNFDSECASGSCVNEICDDGLSGPGEPCSQDSDCESGACDESGGTCEEDPGGDCGLVCPPSDENGVLCCPEDCKECVDDVCVSICDGCSSCIEGECEAIPGFAGPRADGACCDDSQCNTSACEKCLNGVCTDTCPVSEGVCTEGECRVDDCTGRGDGTPCFDGFTNCDVGECQAGECISFVDGCLMLFGPCGECEEIDGVPVCEISPSGTLCEVGVATGTCSSEGTCVVGDCSGAPDGNACNDGPGACNSGACQGGFCQSFGDDCIVLFGPCSECDDSGGLPVCVPGPQGALCEVGSATGTCDANGTCVVGDCSGAPDGNACNDGPGACNSGSCQGGFCDSFADICLDTFGSCKTCSDSGGLPECVVNLSQVGLPCTVDDLPGICDSSGTCNPTDCSNSSDGTPCSTGGTDPCNIGVCVQGTCTSEADICDDFASTCQVASCNSTSGTAECEFQPLSDGTACVVEPGGNPGTCLAGVCLASSCAGQSDGAACSDSDNNGCTNGVCAGGACTPVEVFCPSDGTDDCVELACVSTGAFTFNCEAQLEPDGSPCADSDGDPCTFGACQSSVCVPAPACPQTAIPCQVTVCTPDGPTFICSNEDIPDGASCDDTDSDACTVGQCLSGACISTLTCPQGSNPCQLATCSDVGGTANCGTQNVPDDATCDDGDACTIDDVCISGQCVGFDICP